MAISDNNEYSDEGFWAKVASFAKAAGKELIEKALWLYYAAQDPATPAWAKGIVYGALGYFILPIDAIPDVTPVIGYTDDLGVLAAAVTIDLVTLSLVVLFGVALFVATSVFFGVAKASFGSGITPNLEFMAESS